MAASDRTILFLMGPTSSFWRELADEFEARGARVVKVCFGMGDWLFWRPRSAVHYRGRLSRWPAFLEALIDREKVTDILYYADRQPYHLAASKIARAKSIPAMTIENGYLRPDWITLEQGGMGAYSHFPADPAVIRRLAEGVPQPDLSVKYPAGFWTEMVHEAAFHLFNYSWRIFYPFYTSGKYYDPLLEILIGLPGLVGQKRREAAAARLIGELAEGSAPYFVCALQMQGDYQIRANSAYAHISEMIEEVIASFAREASAEARLVFKQHPHDNGRENWPGHIRRSAARHGVESRVHFMDGGDLGKLLEKARGCVIINSTVGLFALRKLCPTKLLGIAIYDMPGLTHQGPLESFWQRPAPVDAGLFDDFVRVLAAGIQVKGSFYHEEGKARAIREVVSRVLAGEVVGGPFSVATPPRLEQAAKAGIAIDWT